MAASGKTRNMQNFDIIQPSLIQQMRSILDQYPDDGQILKELIQNAEDAKARTIKFLFDKSTFPAFPEQMEHKDLVHFQGPALYAFNDATFSEEDWMGIRTIYDSFKKDDPIKVGRFGLGFKSVFHMTDMPSILSGNKIGFLDPHERYFRDEEGRPLKGACWNLSDICDDQSGFYSPFTDSFLSSIFNQTRLENDYYDGTLFRFPLRKPENQSKLDTDEYSPGKLELLFEQFEQYSYMCLLFLTSLESIELYVRQSRDHQPELFFKVALSESRRAAVGQNRQRFRDNIDTETWMESPVCVTQEVLIDAQNATTTSHHWLVTNFFAGGDQLPTLKQMFAEKTLFYPPWVAVAMSMDDDFEPGQPRGHVFCFLPLPIERKSQTGLPVHVNGFFAIDQNRRHLKWPNAEQLGAQLPDKGLRWNQAMLAEAVPMAYKELVINAIKLKVSQNLIYKAIPFLKVVDDKWFEMVEIFLKHMSHIPFLYTVQGGGRHVQIHEALFSFLTNEQHPDVINDILVKADKPVVCIPEHLRYTLETIKNATLSVVTPSDLRESVKKIQDKTSPFPETKTHCMQILAYAMHDEQFGELVGLNLVPLLSGTCVAFQAGNVQDKIFLTNTDHPAELFPGLESLLVSNAVTDSEREVLEMIAMSGETNMASMKKEDAVKMFQLVFPPHWVKDLLSWTRENHVTLAWIELVWNYLVKMFLDDLSPVERLHLLPLKSFEGALFLKRLTRKSAVIFYDQNSEGFRHNTSSLLKKLGVFVADGLFPFIQRHPCIFNYVNVPSVSGVLHALSALELSLLIKKMIELPSELVHQFRFEIAQGDVHVLQQFRGILRALPMFRVTENTLSRSEDRLYALEEIGCIAPGDEFPFRLPKPFIQVENESSRHLSLVLGATELSLADLIVNHIFPSISAYPPLEVDKMLEYLIYNHMQLVDGNPELRGFVTQLNIFQRCDGELVSLTSLFDPSDEKLMELFYGQDVFLAGACSSNKILPNLRTLGLKTYKDVEAQEILLAARHVGKLAHNQNVVLKAHAIQTFLSQRKASYLDKEINGWSLREHLQDTAWVPVKTRPDNYPCQLTWFGGANKFQKPSWLHDVTHGNLVGMLKEVADLGMVSGLRVSETTLKDVTDNLFNIARVINPSTDNVLQLRSLVYCVYDYMQRQIITDPHLTRMMVDNFKGRKCILVEDDRVFVTPEEVSFTEDLAPFRHKIPNEMKLRFQALLKSMGVQHRFNVEAYCTILSEIEAESRGYPLSKERLDLVRRTAERLATSLNAEGLPQDVYLPNDAKEVMKLSSTLCYNDCPWIPDADMSFVHKGIPFHVAKALGVQTKRTKALERSSFGIPFGQKEKLTNRIKRILEGYPSDVDILKEMLQNADDAQATEIHFCLDTRSHSTDRVFEDCWKPLQGPALCVYNDKPFTEDDVYAIQNLGEGNKGDDPLKTGQYGVGFNAVYHVTDVPSLLTNVVGKGERLYVFDPHCAFVPSATPYEPGRCFADLDNLKNMFPSVFECYSSVLDTFVESFGGTLFRFPLRDEKMAKKSQIKATPITVKDVRAMLQTFKNEAGKSLLFLNNVRKITVCEIGGTSDVLESFTVSATIGDDCQRNLNEFKEYVKAVSAIAKMIPGNIWSIQSKEVAYEMTVSSTNMARNKWLIAQKFGFETNEKIPQMLRDAFSRNEIQLLPRGGVACELTSPKQDDVHNVFCFLPLPQTTKLPVHINGHFALDHEARRRIWTSTDSKKDFKASWNSLLLRFVIAHAYVRLVDEFKHRFIGCSSGDTTVLPKVTTLLNLFPFSHQDSDEFSDLVRRFYTIMNEKQVSALCMIQGPLEESALYTTAWFPPGDKGPNGPLFDTLGTGGTLPLTFNDRKSCDCLKDLLLKCEMKVLWRPVSILIDEFEKSGVACRSLTSETVLEFFKTPVACSAILSHPTDVIDILKFCKSAQHFPDLLEGVHLLMTESQKIEKFTSKRPRYLTTHATLVNPEYHDEFVHHRLVQSVFHSKRFLEISCFKEFTVKSLSTKLPGKLLGQHEVVYGEDDKFVEWIQELWCFICKAQRIGKSNENDLARFLGQFCLIPACREKADSPREHVLVQIRRSKNVVDPKVLHEKRNILNSLKRLGVPMLSDIVPSNPFLVSVVSSVTKPLDILTAIELERENGAINDILTKQQCLYLLRYLCSDLKETHDNLRRIKQLPFFCTRSGSFISISGKRVFVLGTNLRTKDAHLWEDNETVLFLESEFIGEDVREFLGIEKIKRADLYKDYVLPHLAKMSDESRRDLLEYIRHVVIRPLFGKDRESFISVMKKTPFIKNDHGRLVKASVYYDWYNTVFAEMMSEKQFPPEYFKTPKWRAFLLELGLQHSVSGDQFVQFAKEVAGYDTHSQYVDKQRKSEVLMDYLLRNQNSLSLEVIKEIAFVPQQQLPEEIIRLHPRYSDKKFVKMSGAVVSNAMNVNLVWSAANLLSRSFSFSKRLADALEIHVLPPVSLVIRHCSNVCTNLYQQKPSTKKETWGGNFMLQIMKNMYAFLRTNTTEMSLFDKDVLRNTPFVVVNESNAFVYARQIVEDIRKEEQIEPYLYKLPTEIAEFRHLFFSLGASEHLSVYLLGNVLFEIAHSASAEVLHIDAMKKARRAFISLLGCSDDAIANASFEKGLFAPTRDGEMVLAGQCVFVDDERLYEEIKSNFTYPVLIKTLAEVFDSKQKLLKLGEQYRPLILSEIIHEQVETAGEIRSHEESNYSITKEVFQRLTCDLFHHALARLIFHISSQSNQPMKGVLKDVQEKFEKVKVFEADAITSYYVDESGNKLCESISSSKVSVIRGKESFLEVYIHPTEDRSEIYNTLTEYIADNVGVTFNTRCLIVLRELLKLKHSAVYLSSYLDKSRIMTIPVQKLDTHMGETISGDMSHIMEQGFFRFDVNELVGYYTGEQTDDGESKYVVAQVCRELESSEESPGGVKQRYVVNIGFDEVEVASVDLYKFWQLSSQDVGGKIRILDIEATKHEIDIQIEEARMMPKDQRGRVMWRLFMHWHPDAGEENREARTEISNYLERCWAKCEESTRHSALVGIDQQSIRKRVIMQHDRRRRCKQSYAASCETGGGLWFLANPPLLPNPRPSSARQWYRQAVDDFNSSQNDIPPGAVVESYIWACYKCNQAAEKALKAAQFAVDSNLKSETHDIAYIAHTLDMPDTRELRYLADDLRSLLGGWAKMCYPDVLVSEAPSDRFSEYHAEEAKRLTGAILDIVRAFLENRGVNIDVT